MNIFIKLKIITILLNIVLIDIKGDVFQNNITTNDKCVTSDGKVGVCLVKDICNDVNVSRVNDCPNEGDVCCMKSIVKNFNFWTPINQFWNNLQTIANITSSYPNSTYIPSPVNTSWSTPSAPNVGSHSDCGLRNLDKDYGYIVGGGIAPAHSWPWAVAVYTGSGNNINNYRFVCGASVISGRYVLGAAHCVSHSNRVTRPENIRLLIGSHDRRSEGTYYRVEKVIVHQRYDERLMQNDIALYKLVESIKFRRNQNIAPVCLPDPSMEMRNYTRTMAYLVGWGTTSAGGQTSDFLREVQVPIITNRQCARSYNSLMITSKQMCAGYSSGQMDSCQGDSGGPMTVQMEERDGRYVQIGIVSWGKGCAEPKYPGVYSKVSSFMDWIQSHINS